LISFSILVNPGRGGKSDPGVVLEVKLVPLGIGAEAGTISKKKASSC